MESYLLAALCSLLGIVIGMVVGQLLLRAKAEEARAKIADADAAIAESKRSEAEAEANIAARYKELQVEAASGAQRN
jgi:uncharacterized membrane-anchored protein YhcB (DUF1043 family)